MKKLFSGVLVLVMMLSMLSTAFAVPYTLEDMGITIDVPEGMTPVDMSTEDAVMIDITVDDNEALHYAFILGFLERFEGRALADLNEDEVLELVEEIAANAEMEGGSYSVEDLDGIPVLVIENADVTLAYILVLDDGWVLSVAMGKTDGVSLTDEEIETAVGLLTSIEFEDVAEE